MYINTSPFFLLKFSIETSKDARNFKYFGSKTLLSRVMKKKRTSKSHVKTYHRESHDFFQRRGGGLKIVFRPIPFPASLRSSHFIKIAPSPRPRLPINPWKRYFSAENDISSNKNVLVRPSWNSGVKPCRLVTIRHSSVRCNPGKTWDRVKKSFFPFFFFTIEPSSIRSGNLVYLNLDEANYIKRVARSRETCVNSLIFRDIRGRAEV